MREATLAVHDGDDRGPNGPVADSIHVATTYTWDSFEEEPKWVYSRLGHPNGERLESQVAALEAARFATAFGSGMAAITACLEWAKAGEHILVADDIYGGTLVVARDVLARHAVSFSSFDPLDLGSIDNTVQDNTKLLIFESPTNPTMRVVDIAAVAAKGKELGILTIFDNTFASPIVQRPFKRGVDVVCHATTKYLGGHSDVLGGIVLTNREDIHGHVRSYAAATGGVPGPFDCWLTSRGIRTLVPRMRMHCDNALRVATYLESHPKVKHVNYPGLPSHPQYELAKRQMKGFGGMLSFVVDGNAETAMRLGKSCRIFKMAASLGGIESLISYPPKLSHAGLSEEERLARGIPPNMLRLSIGIEDPEDLIEDLDRALSY